MERTLIEPLVAVLDEAYLLGNGLELHPELHVC